MGENVEVGVYPTRKAISMANEQELDLVEISPKAVPPVCKIIDYKKFLYEQKKRDNFVLFANIHHYLRSLTLQPKYQSSLKVSAN